jgi:hypothetical protein
MDFCTFQGFLLHFLVKSWIPQFTEGSGCNLTPELIILACFPSICVLILYMWFNVTSVYFSQIPMFTPLNPNTDLADHNLEDTIWPPVPISNPIFNWLLYCSMWQFYEWNTSEVFRMDMTMGRTIFFCSGDPSIFLSSWYAKQVQHGKEGSGEVQLK